MKHIRQLFLICLLAVNITTLAGTPGNEKKIAEIRKQYNEVKANIEKGVSMENLFYCTTIVNRSTVPAIGWVTRTINIYSVPPEENECIPGDPDYHNIILFITITDDANGMKRTYYEYLYDRKGEPIFAYQYNLFNEKPMDECRFYYDNGQMLKCLPETAHPNNLYVYHDAELYKEFADKVNQM